MNSSFDKICLRIETLRCESERRIYIKPVKNTLQRFFRHAHKY